MFKERLSPTSLKRALPAPATNAMSSHSPAPSTQYNPARSSPVVPSSDKLTGLATSSNSVAAGVGEVLQAFAAATNANMPNARPIMVEFGNRTMAIGRARMSAMNGRNAFLYMKSKFGLLNATTAFFLEATFDGDGEQYVEIDLDSWEELVAYMHRLRIIS